MDEPLSIVSSEFILGGQKSGKSRRAELLARHWLAGSPEHRAVLIATATAGDEEMRARIARHQADRAERVPGLATVEEPLQLAEAIRRHSRPDTLLVVDCLTLWLTNWLMPACPHPGPLPEGEGSSFSLSPRERAGGRVADVNEQASALLRAIRHAPGPVVLVGNEIGLGVIPLGRELRAFVDTLGRLNQDLAQACARVTLMAAGLPLTLKDKP